ncbi:hypothetical protein BDQ12DRAFT_474044 [Crucibulum laeve]|uniref:Uncharacterized protein n=1 Tax=Crucibulum laeve TaxID=68775 RepID=A0A5C3LKM4_9AGAR|nr:hypothetical protein BDQ12DRAFT_474044 [Crucibulum laeve]
MPTISAHDTQEDGRKDLRGKGERSGKGKPPPIDRARRVGVEWLGPPFNPCSSRNPFSSRSPHATCLRRPTPRYLHAKDTDGLNTPKTIYGRRSQLHRLVSATILFFLESYLRKPWVILDNCGGRFSFFSFFTTSDLIAFGASLPFHSLCRPPSSLQRISLGRYR